VTVSSSDLSVDKKNGSIIYSSSLACAYYKETVIGTLPDNTQTSADFIVFCIPKNDPPYFSPNLTNIVVPL
jgi:hypothetical protein